MMGTAFPARAMKAHHDQMLIVKVKSSARDVARGDAEERSPGLAALLRSERAGQLRRISHLKRSTGEKGKPGVSAHIADAARDARSGAPYHGCLIIHLHDRASRAELRRALARDPHIAYAEPVPVRYAFAVAPQRTIPFPLEREWSLRSIQWPQARRLTRFRRAHGIRVAVLDSGVDVRHPGLKGVIAEYVYRHRDLKPLTSARDLMGHGTHIAGIIGARTRAPMGVQGICQCRLTIHKVFLDEAAFNPSLGLFLYVVDPVLYRRALTDCVEHGAEVVNLSLGGAGKPDSNEDALLQTLLGRGASVVAAMGNGRTVGSPTMYPAAVPGVIAVGATDANDTVAPFSSRGAHIALCAPGVGIWSTLPRYAGQFGFHAERDGRGRSHAASPISRNAWYDAWPGTSMATPHVTAAAVLLRASRPGVSGAEVRERIMRTADRVPGMGRAKFTPDYGSGRLNLRRLLAD